MKSLFGIRLVYDTDSLAFELDSSKFVFSSLRSSKSVYVDYYLLGVC